jgi:SAM-dependent methyltransferase
MSSNTRNQLENWLKTIDIDGNHIADIGGAQNSLEKRTKTWNPDAYTIFDLEEPHQVHVDKWYNLDIQKEMGEGIKGYYMESYDTVFCIEVSEYWFDPITALKNINDMLEKNGILYISFHFVYPQHPPMGLDYLRYTPAGVEKILKETGFEIEEHLFRKTENSDMRSIWCAEGMRGWKEMDNSIVGSLIRARKI